MRTFLGLVLVLMVSGDGEVAVTGVLEQSVLLPCTCLDRNLTSDFKWQKKGSEMKLLFINNTNKSYFGPDYKGRAKIFLNENSSNCSILLTNITEGDQGRYSCIFTSKTYQSLSVNLNVSARYSVRQHAPINQSDGVWLHQCDVKAHYREPAIQWNLDEKLLTNTSTMNISITRTVDASTGLHHLTSKLRTELSWTSEPKCVIKPEDITTTAPITSDGFRRHDFPFIIIVTFLGLSLVLCCKITRFHRGQMERDNFKS